MGLTNSNEDYLKAVWKINEWQEEPVSSGQLAKALDLSRSTVSEGVGRLVALGLVRHAPYGAVRLTSEGKRQAARMVRAHRLIETALVQIFDYSWDEVHEEAERLEHAVSDRFIERLDHKLGHPERDPHGDRIPAPHEFEAHSQVPVSLIGAQPGATVRVERVSDDHSDVLVYLESAGIVPGIEVTVETAQPDPTVLSITCAGVRSTLPRAAAQAVIIGAGSGGGPTPHQD
ncbi:metal-dependent transcriptional regulator [Ancrocorticia populi]|uniref:metal-dependent transcriptional regulator n=1 Tax=Ancrocorticia populi TaxID=2175228 RepID=UPI001401CFF0|nr:metal-dependent transcriptional regulator [Ancrocorticia populi]